MAKLHLDLSVALTHTCVLVVGKSGDSTLQRLRVAVKISPAFPSLTTSLLFSEKFVYAVEDFSAQRAQVSQFVSYNLGFGHVFRFYGGNHDALQKFAQQRITFDAQCSDFRYSTPTISKPASGEIDSVQHLVPPSQAFQHNKYSLQQLVAWLEKNPATEQEIGQLLQMPNNLEKELN